MTLTDPRPATATATSISRSPVGSTSPRVRGKRTPNTPATKTHATPRVHPSPEPNFPPTSAVATPKVRTSAGASSPAAKVNAASMGLAPQGSDVRAWARANGYDVADRGRIPRDVLDAYHHSNPAAVAVAVPSAGAPQGPNSPTARKGATPKTAPRPEPNFPPTTDGTTPIVGASAGTNSPAARVVPTPMAHPPQGSGRPQAEAIPVPSPIGFAPLLADPLLNLAADVVDDLERVRIANVNRLRQALRGGPDYLAVFPKSKDDGANDKDGESRGFRLPLAQPDIARLYGICQAMGGPKLDGAGGLEHEAILNLQRQVRRHPLWPWAKQHKGIGEKQFARLLAAIGDPYWNTLHDRPRTVSELWAYCGYHTLPTGHALCDTQVGPAGRSKQDGGPSQAAVDAQSSSPRAAVHRRKGVQVNWNTAARMRANRVAEKCIQQKGSDTKDAGHYRLVYEAGRDKYADATHVAPCIRCGPKGKPAPVGSELSDGHKHARAVRLVTKEILKDVWREAKRLHEQGVTQ